MTVVLLDLNEFKQLNDRAGHAAGDDALRACAKAWRRESAPFDSRAVVGLLDQSDPRTSTTTDGLGPSEARRSSFDEGICAPPGAGTIRRSPPRHRAIETLLRYSRQGDLYGCRWRNSPRPSQPPHQAGRAISALAIDPTRWPGTQADPRAGRPGRRAGPPPLQRCRRWRWPHRPRSAAAEPRRPARRREDGGSARVRPAPRLVQAMPAGDGVALGGARCSLWCAER